MNNIEIVNVKEDLGKLPREHPDLFDKTLQWIVSGETKFSNWDLIK